MALSTEQREANYRAQRQGGELTARQRRRIRQAENRAQAAMANMSQFAQSRIRKGYEKRGAARVRQSAVNLITSMRLGHLRPRVQAEMRAQYEEMVARMQAEVEAQQSVEVVDGEVTGEVSDVAL